MRELLLAERIDLGQRVMANLVFQIENRIPAGVSDINIVVNIVVHVCRDRINTVFIRLQNRLAVLHRNRRIIMHLELQITPIGRTFHPVCTRIGFACQLPAGGVHYGHRVFAVQDEPRSGDVFRPQLIGGLGVDVPLALIVLKGGTYEVQNNGRIVSIPFNTAAFIQLFQLLQCIARGRCKVVAGLVRRNPECYRIAIFSILVYGIDIAEFVLSVRAIVPEARVPHTNRQLSWEHQQKRPVGIDDAEVVGFLFLVIVYFDFLVIQIDKIRFFWQTEREIQIESVRHAQFNIPGQVPIFHKQHPVSSVHSDLCCGAVACPVRNDDLIPESFVPVAAVRRTQLIDLPGLHALLLAVDRHRLDAGHRLALRCRVSDRKVNRAERPVVVVVGGVVPSVYHALDHRRRGVLRRHISAHGAFFHLAFPVAGRVLSILRTPFLHRVSAEAALAPPDMAAPPVFPAIDMVLTRGIHHGHFQFGDGPAIVLHIRQCQQRHIDESALIGNQEIREIPEEIASAIGSQGIGLHPQPHNRALLFRADLDGVIGGNGGVLYQLLRFVHQVAIAHGRCVRGVVQTSCRQPQMRIRHGNVLAVHPASAADGRAVNALRRDIAAGDGDVMRGNILPAADARAVVAAVGRDRAAGDVDVVGGIDTIHVLRRLPAAAANARAALNAGSDHIAAVNIDLAAPPLIAAADAGGPSAAGGPHSSGVKIQLLPGSSSAGADARAVFAAVGYDRAAPVVRIALRAEMDVHAMAVHVFVVKAVKNIPGSIAAADAGSLCAALARHRGPGSRQHIQRALAAVLLNGRASGRALQRAVPANEVQIGRGLVVDLDGRRLGAGTHLDVQAVNENMRRGL